MQIAYKLKRISLEDDGIKIKMVERFIDGKHDKFIPLSEVIEFLDRVVIYEKDFDSIKSKTEVKREKKITYKQQLVNSILFNME